MSENHDQLIAWINKVENQINLVKQDFIKNDDFKLIYMIGSTSSSNENSQPYTTPIRKISNAYIIGSIVFTQAQAKILAFKIDGQVDYIFLDAEKKLPTTVKPDYSPYRLFNLKHLVPKKKDPIEFGNISAACVKIVKKSIVQEYKANDVTVDATWNFLTNRSIDLSGKKIIIFGTGNIGLKLALKLVECGSEIVLVSRKNKKEINEIVKSLNVIKNKGVLSKISISNERNINTHENVDILIGCTNSNPVINQDIIHKMSNNGIVIDLGKGTISEAGVSECKRKGIEMWRVDITPMLDSIVSASFSMNNLIKNIYGKKDLEIGIRIVSGGYIGDKYDVVVDNFNIPKVIIGVCDSPGKFMEKFDEKSKNIINSINDYIKTLS